MAEPRHLLVPYERRTYCGAQTFPVTTAVDRTTCPECLEAWKVHEVEQALASTVTFQINPGATLPAGSRVRTHSGRSFRTTASVTNRGSSRAEFEIPIMRND